MNTQAYQQKRMTADDVAESVRSGDTVFLPGGALTPVEVGNALGNLAGLRRNVTLLTYLPLAATKVYTVPDGGETFQIQSIFHNRVLHGAISQGWCGFIPNNLRHTARDWHDAVPEIDLMVLTVSPMDRHGWFTLAGQTVVEMDLLPYARRVVVEVASHAPRVFGDTAIHISQVWGIVESDRYPCLLPRETPTPEDETLGAHVAQLVADGDTVQLGFGGTIDALARQLRHKQGLGIHTESFSDSAMELLECGAVTNANKSLYPGITVTSFTMGTEKLFDYVNDNLSILHKSISYTNSLEVIARNRNMVSINATLYVDLTGQCASESAGTHQISGSGGQVDTGVGAQLGGGKSIITVKSTRVRTDPDTGLPERESCILPVLPLGTAVTYTRSNVQYVATEYGVVCLRGQTVPQRARLLISIAHPDYRPWLEEEFQRLYQMKL